MTEKYNFKIDSTNKTISISISPLIFPRPVILLAAYHFIEDSKVIVDGDENLVTVTLIPEKKLGETELEELAYEFNIQLISSFVEDEESRKHVGTRETMLKAALTPPPRPSPPPSQRPSPPENYPKEGE